MKNWEFLPLWLHSLDPWDRIVMKLIGLLSCCRDKNSVIINEPVDAVSKATLESPFPCVGYKQLSTVPSAASMSGICTSVKVVKDPNPRQEEEYKLLLSYASQSPSPNQTPNQTKPNSPRGSI